MWKPGTVSNEIPVGLSSISVYQPQWGLGNDWFTEIPKKFERQTGIRRRPVATEDEVTLAARALDRLQGETGCRWRDCAGIVFTSPSFVPAGWARRTGGARRARDEQLTRAAHRLVRTVGMAPRRIAATNTFCAGYARALEIVQRKWHRSLALQEEEFVLVVTSSRISRITNYACRNTAGLFGDMATATLIARCDSRRYPVKFELKHAHVEQLETNRPFFDFERQVNVPIPEPDGGIRVDPDRIVFKLDGMGIAESASRAMAAVAESTLPLMRWQADEVRHVIPHQAGLAIVRLAEMKLRDAGFTGEVLNGMTETIGNVSSGSVPYALHQQWSHLSGRILCPVASVASPGKCAVAMGCVALESMPERPAITQVA